MDQAEIKNKVAISFGEDIINKGQVDTERLRERVFNDKDALRMLEDIVHPFVLRRLHERINLLKTQGTKVIIVDGPLIYEKGLYRELNKVIVVSADRERIIERTKRRGMKEEDIKRRMAIQIPLNKKERMADYVIYNNGTIEDLEQETALLLQKIKEWEEGVDAP
jgi:dephospho-CoA kinase